MVETFCLCDYEGEAQVSKESRIWRSGANGRYLQVTYGQVWTAHDSSLLDRFRSKDRGGPETPRISRTQNIRPHNAHILLSVRTYQDQAPTVPVSRRTLNHVYAHNERPLPADT